MQKLFATIFLQDFFFLLPSLAHNRNKLTGLQQSGLSPDDRKELEVLGISFLAI